MAAGKRPSFSLSIARDPETRAILQKIAAQYERLARHTAERKRYAARGDDLRVAECSTGYVSRDGKPIGSR